MKPAKRAMDYEKVAIGVFIFGKIEKIEYEENHTFKYKDNEKIAPAVRFVFKLDGYEYSHRSRWMSFYYSEKSNLYQKYLLKLVENAKPDMDFDIENLESMRVKTLWQENGDFQNLESIFPEGKKLTWTPPAETQEPHEEDGTSEEVPF